MVLLRPIRSMGLWMAIAATCSCRGHATGGERPGAVEAGPLDRIDLVGEIGAIVEKEFYSPALLERIGWRAAVARARRAAGSRGDRAARTRAIRALLAALKTSHTEYYPRDDPAYWDMASLFEPFLRAECAPDRSPRWPVARDDIGVFWRRDGTRWFAAGVFAGGPAESAGLRAGDEVLLAGGRPFSPVEAFAGKAGRKVALEVRRARDAPPLRLWVAPRTARPQEAYRDATARSWRILERGGNRIGYLRVWSWAGPEIQEEVLRAITRANTARVDGLILDLRDGWGGASPHYLSMFFQEVPVLESIDRDGRASTLDAQVRRPAVILINRGTRSGKEVVAYGARKHRLARLVGERTAGAVMFGGPRCLSDGSLLILAVSDARVDGERLEGRGVEPDIEVPFDFRYAGGADPQLERALGILTGE